MTGEKLTLTGDLEFPVRVHEFVLHNHVEEAEVTRRTRRKAQRRQCCPCRGHASRQVHPLTVPGKTPVRQGRQSPGASTMHGKTRSVPRRGERLSAQVWSARITAGTVRPNWRLLVVNHQRAEPSLCDSCGLRDKRPGPIAGPKSFAVVGRFMGSAVPQPWINV